MKKNNEEKTISYKKSIFVILITVFFLLSCVSNVIVMPNVVPIIKLAMPIISDVVSAMRTVPFCLFVYGQNGFKPF